MELGEILIWRCGTHTKVVDKLQRRQTRGYSLGLAGQPNESLKRYRLSYSWKDVSWAVVKGGERSDHWYLCPVDELDDAVNEWGPVSP